MTHPRYLFALGALGFVALTATALPATAETEDPLDQTVPSEEEIGTEQVTIEAGHVDVGPRFIDGEWQILARDDTTAPPVWRYLDDVVLHLGDSSVLPAPEDEQFDFVDAEPGQDLYVVPQTENFDVPWVGWNSQDPEVVERLAGGMTLRFHGVDGPGQFTLFLQNGNFDDAALRWSSDLSEPQDLWAEENTHVHGNWVFTAPGVYLVDVELTAELADGSTVSDRDVLRFAVGQETDPGEALAATYAGGEAEPGDGAAGEQGETTESEAGGPGESDTGGSDSGERSAGDASAGESDDSGSVPVVALATAAAVALLAAVIIVSALRSRRARAEAAREGGEHADD